MSLPMLCMYCHLRYVEQRPSDVLAHVVYVDTLSSVRRMSLPMLCMYCHLRYVE